VNARPGTEQQHYIRSLPYKYRQQVEFLRQRFNNEETGHTMDSCHIVEYKGARRKKCGISIFPMRWQGIANILGIDHYQGEGQMLKATCDVRFTRVTPIDLDECPYIIWASFGIHTHPPPSVNKTPEEIRKGLIEVVRRINDPCLTRSKLLGIYYENIANVLSINQPPFSRIHTFLNFVANSEDGQYKMYMHHLLMKRSLMR